MNQCPVSPQGIDPIEFGKFLAATQETIQCALLQSALEGGMTVYFPLGRYCVEQTIVLPPNARPPGVPVPNKEF